MGKGQASLEMVVGLIILLVVAGVVISLVIYYINPQKMPSPGEQLSIRTFLTNCETYCHDMSTNKFCTYYYTGNDWDKDGLKYDLVKVGKYEWPTCEDRVYCFLTYQCDDRFGSGLSAIEKCRQILCQTYMEKYGGDAALANQSLYDNIQFSTKCNLNDVTGPDNWYTGVFGKGCE